jgi:zinc transport system ATP-binding protein
MSKIKHGPTIISLQNVSFSYHSEMVLRDISLEIHRGDYVGIVGPNGGGKSTLLKVILGLLKPTKGKITLFDHSKIGYVPQKTVFDTNFPITVEEAVAMGRYGKRGLFRLLQREDYEKVQKALKQVDMEAFCKRQVSDLSGGQQQRVFIARALAAEPEIIILDEPTVGVDIKTQKHFYTLLRKLNNELALTLVLVSHELDIVAHEATELGYINRTMEFYGDPKIFVKGDYFKDLIGKFPS